MAAASKLLVEVLVRERRPVRQRGIGECPLIRRTAICWREAERA